MRADSPRCHHTLPLHTVHRVLPHGHNQHDYKQQGYTYTNPYEGTRTQRKRVYLFRRTKGKHKKGIMDPVAR